LVTADILPASLEVSTYQIEDLGPIANELKSNTAVQEVVYQKDVIATLTSWTNALRRIGLAIIIILGFVSILIMVTIISIKVSQKREEIEIMRLIGATNWYISLPFVYEAVFYATIGALIGWTISSLGLWYLSPFLSSFLKGIPLLPINVVFLLGLLGGELIIAIFLGVLSSLIGVNRFLNR
jgi:cell division transport system permease protein